MNNRNCHFYLIRHGEIDANVKQLWHGSTDSELNSTGMKQAALMASHIVEAHPEISAIYCSPLQRTRATSEPLAEIFKLPALTEEGLREYSIGQLEQTSYQVLQQQHQFFDRINNDQDYAPRGGESPREVCLRMITAMTAIALRHPGESIALVGHGAAMAIALTHILEQRISPFHDYHMANTGYSKLVWSDQPYLEFFNKTAHLDSSHGR